MKYLLFLKYGLVFLQGQFLQNAGQLIWDRQKPFSLRDVKREMCVYVCVNLVSQSLKGGKLETKFYIIYDTVYFNKWLNKICLKM